MTVDSPPVSPVSPLVGRAQPASVWRGPLALLSGAAALIFIGVAVGLRRSSAFQSFAVVFLSIVLEALPFVILGSLLSATLEVATPRKVTAALSRMPVALAVPVAALLGVLFPVCECGSVPVARRLARRGLPPTAALAYMLAAPVVNPIVVIATAVAFRGRTSIVFGRVVIAYAVALVVAFTMQPEARQMFRERVDPAGDGHDHGSSGQRFTDVFTGDLVFMFRYLVVGAVLASGIQALVPRRVLDGVSGSPLGGILALMVLAAVVSICSEADAFVAASFTGFAPGALVAFLVFGPMIDLKLIAIYRGAFGLRRTIRLALAVAATVVVGALWFQVIQR